MRSGVRLAARMPAVRATPKTSPFASWPARAAESVAGLILMVARATASRTVSGLAETSTIRASPEALRWGRPRNPGPPRGADMRRVKRLASGVQPRVTNHDFHAVLRDELELLELADAPLLIEGEERAPVQRRQLLVVLPVLGLELAELLAFGGQPLDQ